MAAIRNSLSIAPGSAGQILTSNGTGSAPSFQAAASGGMQLIETITASAAANVSFITGINSSYENYVLIFNNLIGSTGTSLNFRVSSDGGATYIATGYDLTLFFYNGGGTSRESFTTLIPVANSATLDTTMDAGGTYYFYGITKGAGTSSLSAQNAWDRGGGNGGGMVAGTLPSTSVNAIQLAPAAGTISGKFSLYRLSM